MSHDRKEMPTTKFAYQTTKNGMTMKAAMGIPAEHFSELVDKQSINVHEVKVLTDKLDSINED